MDADVTFGEALRQFRAAAKLSQEGLSRQADVPVRTISDLERGKNVRPRIDTARRLAAGLELDDERLNEFWKLAGYESRSPTLRGQLPSVPAPLVSILGRDELVGRIVDEVLGDSRRLLTLTGAAGVGKTTVAQEVARITSTTRSTVVVAMAHLRHADHVLPTIAGAIDVDPQDRLALDLLAAFFEREPCVLVLDNLEQIPDVRVPIARLLERCPSLSMVTTSRLSTKVKGEREILVEPLPTLDEGGSKAGCSTAARLFIDRAIDNGSSSTDLDDATAQVERICQTLGGLPLAIELAAARCQVMSLSGMLDSLDRVLELLPKGFSQQDHHRTLRAAIDWSYNLLDDSLRELFVELGIFRDAVSIGAISQVCKSWSVLSEFERLDVLDRIRDHHLVDVVLEVDDGDAVVSMLEPIRQYVAEKLRDSDAIEELEDRLIGWAIAYVGDESAAVGSDRVSWVRRIDRALPNIRRALDSAASRGDQLVEEALRLNYGLWRYWVVRGQWDEGAERLAGALELEGGGVRSRADAQRALGVMFRSSGDTARAMEALQGAGSLYSSIGDTEGVASCLNNLGNVYLDVQETEKAVGLYREALKLISGREADMLESIVSNNLALPLLHGGDAVTSFPLIVRARRLCIASGNLVELDRVLDNLSLCLSLRGHHRWALGTQSAAAVRKLDLNDLRGISWSLANMAHILLRASRPVEAAFVVGAVDGLVAEGGQLSGALTGYLQEAEVRLTQELGDEGYRQRVASGRSVPNQDLAEWISSLGSIAVGDAVG